MLQNLGSTLDRVLAAAATASLRTEDATFSSREVVELLQVLRVPPPANVPRDVSNLKAKGLVLPLGKGRHALTPNGRQRVVEVLGDIDVTAIAVEAATQPGADFAHAYHTLLHHSFAPARWAPGIKRLLTRYPFEQNVFLMTRFPAGSATRALQDPVAGAVADLRATLGLHGLTLHLASDSQLDDDLFGNVGAYMWACKYGIGLLEERGPKAGLNQNVLIELGGMLMMGRRCAILRDGAAAALPTDLAGQIYKTVDLTKMETVRDAVHLWVAEDLNLGRCSTCPVTARP